MGEMNILKEMNELDKFQNDHWSKGERLRQKGATKDIFGEGEPKHSLRI